MARVTRPGLAALLACLASLIGLAAGCSGHGTTSTPSAASQSPAKPVTEQVADGRFTVTFSGAALGQATAAGINLPMLVARDLGHINALLPGPKTTISVSYYSRAALLIPKNGTSGYTDPLTGNVTAAFGPVPQVSPRRVLIFWFPRDLAHEVSHSVRIPGKPGYIPGLFQRMIAEGIATAFDQAAFPGPPDPWTRAIGQAQECQLWERAQPWLTNPSLAAYDLWMFGGYLHGYTVPDATGFAIGYHIVTGYRDRHPNLSWPALTSTSAASILAGSHYQPCSH